MIASVAAVCDLDLVVIGGGVAKSGTLLFDPLREELHAYARLDFLAGLRVVPAALGGEAGLVGAAALLHEPYARLHESGSSTVLADRAGRAILGQFHRRPSVTEQSVEGPGYPGGPRRRTRLTSGL